MKTGLLDLAINGGPPHLAIRCMWGGLIWETVLGYWSG
jgi:hypothetical protein